jgi:hypothetical protein
LAGHGHGILSTEARFGFMRSLPIRTAAGRGARREEMPIRNFIPPEITDSITQANTKVLGDAPTIAMGDLFARTTQALANAADKATEGLEQPLVSARAAAAESLHSVEAAVAGEPAKDRLKSR